MGLFDRLRSENPRLVFLGIDGVPYDLVEDHPDTFETLHSIAETGTGGPISSIVPPESSACWPVLTTGRNPGATGVYGFQDREPETYETYVPIGSHVQAERLWERVSAAGREATVLNVPVTYPPSDDIQRQVSGFLSPSLEEAVSSSVDEKLLAECGYRIDVDASLGHEEDKAAFIQNAHETLRGRYEVFRHFIAEDDWDLFVGVFMATDRVNHFLYGEYERGGEYADEFLAFYAKLDEYLGLLRDQLADETTLLIASDHGFTTLEFEVHCNRWLETQGWLSYAGSEPSELNDISAETRAYSLIPGRFYLNVEGREPAGTVTESEYSAVRNELIADIESLTGPDGRTVARRVVRGEEVFDGPFDEIAPDLVVIPADGFDLKAGFGTGERVFSSGPRNGMHTFENACLFATEPGLELDNTDLYDIAPTVLDVLDVQYETTEMDGHSLVESS